MCSHMHVLNPHKMILCCFSVGFCLPLSQVLSDWSAHLWTTWCSQDTLLSCCQLQTCLQSSGAASINKCCYLMVSQADCHFDAGATGVVWCVQTLSRMFFCARFHEKRPNQTQQNILVTHLLATCCFVWQQRWSSSHIWVIWINCFDVSFVVWMSFCTSNKSCKQCGDVKIQFLFWMKKAWIAMICNCFVVVLLVTWSSLTSHSSKVCCPPVTALTLNCFHLSHFH